jgi:hypothetical protein
MGVKLARLRFEAKKGMIALSKVTDIETGIVIPVRAIKIDVNVNNMHDGIWATIEVPIEELDLDGVLTKIVTVNDD